MRGRTQQVGRRTQGASVGRHSGVMVDGKDPNFEYSFRRIADIEAGGGIDNQGYAAVGADNYNGETWGGPRSLQSRSRTSKQIRNQDTILCKRPLDVAAHFKADENRKYNAQAQLVLHAGKRARVALRKLDSGAIVENQSKGLERAFKQRPGPTMEE